MGALNSLEVAWMTEERIYVVVVVWCTIMC